MDAPVNVNAQVNAAYAAAATYLAALDAADAAYTDAYADALSTALAASCDSVIAASDARNIGLDAYETSIRALLAARRNTYAARGAAGTAYDAAMKGLGPEQSC